MWLGIDFAKDLNLGPLKPIINFTANSALVCAGALGLAKIAGVALPLLGFSALSIKALTAIPVGIGMFAGGCTGIGLIGGAAFATVGIAWHYGKELYESMTSGS